MNINFFKNLKLVFVAFTATGCVALTACKKTGVSSENFEASNLAVYDYWNDGENASLNFTLDQSNKLHTGQLTFGRYLNYLTVISGKRKANFQSSEDNSPVLSTDIEMANKKVYSLFLTGTKEQPESVFAEDNIADGVPVDKYQIRVANMNTTGGSYNVLVAPKDAPFSDATVLETAVTYKTVTAFRLLSEESGARYDIWAVNPGVDTVVYRNILLVGERSYTIALCGEKNTGYGSQINLVTNLLQF